MKKFLLILTAICSLTFAGLLTTGCQYDDSQLWEEINGVKSELNLLKTQVGQMQEIVDQLSDNNGIVSVQEIKEGYLLTFTDKTTLLLKHGKSGADGSQIGVKKVEDLYYWTLDGDFIVVDGKKLPVTGQDGHSPVPSIDDKGFWCIDGKQILVDGKPVPATGDSFFKKVQVENGKVIFTMADGSEFKVDQATGAVLRFNTGNTFLLTENSTLPFTCQALSFVELDKVPAGLSAKLDEEKSQVTIQITDFQSFINGSRLSLRGADANGNAFLASVQLFLDAAMADFAVINEGWFGHEGGTLNLYYNGNWNLRAYAQVNPGHTLGSTSTVAVQNGDFIYFVSKDEHHIIEADAHTLKHLSSLSWEGCQAMNFVACSKEKGYITTSDGIYELSLNPLKSVKKVSDKSAGDIFQVEGKVYFISQGKVWHFDASQTTDPVEIADAQIGFTQTGDCLWAANKNNLVQINLKDNTTQTFEVSSPLEWNQWAYTPSPLCSSKDGQYVYFPSGTAIIKFNTTTHEVSNFWKNPKGREFYGQQISVHPESGQVYAFSKKAGWGDSFLDVLIEILNPADGTSLKSIRYTDVNNTYWFPSQFVFIK